MSLGVEHTLPCLLSLWSFSNWEAIKPLCVHERRHSSSIKSRKPGHKRLCPPRNIFVLTVLWPLLNWLEVCRLHVWRSHSQEVLSVLLRFFFILLFAKEHLFALFFSLAALPLLLGEDLALKTCPAEEVINLFSFSFPPSFLFPYKKPLSIFMCTFPSFLLNCLLLFDDWGGNLD